MGNQLFSEDNIELNLRKSIVKTSCIFIHWTKPEILKLYNKYISTNYGIGFYVSRANLKAIIRNTKADGTYLEINKLFGLQGRINLLEFFCALVAYSSLELEEKIRLGFYLFDFDGNGIISRDEMTIFLIAFVRGIASITAEVIPSVREISSQSEAIFKDIDSNPDGKITLEEFIDWITSNFALSDFLKGNSKPFSSSPGRFPRIKKKRTENESFQIQTEPAERRSLQRKKSRDFSRPRTTIKKLFVVDTKGRHYTKDQVVRLKKTFDLIPGNKVEVAKLVKKLMTVKEYHGIASNLRKKYPDSSCITFKQLLTLSFNDLDFQEINSMLRWVNYEGEMLNEDLDNKRKDRIERNLSVQTARRLKFVFSKFDSNHDGYIDKEELKEGVKKRLNEESLDAMFDEFDADRNGRLDFEEFLRMVTPNNIDIDPAIVNSLL